MAAQPLLSTSISDTWALASRDAVPAPLALEVLGRPIVPGALQRWQTWLDAFRLRGPPWQDVIDVDAHGGSVSLVLERFVGVTVADVVRNLGEERWVLPAAAWLRLTLDLVEAFERHADALLLEPLGPRAIGWTLDGRLVLAPVCLNAMLATSIDVQDFSALYAPEHVTPGAVADERTLVFSLASTAAWLLTGWHPLEAESGGHVGALLRGERPSSAGWKLAAPAALVEVLEQGLSQDPSRRFPTLRAFSHSLRAALPDVRPSPRPALVGVLQAVTHRLVDRILDDLWTSDTLLPATWEGLWPTGVHPLEGLSVLEDRLLEHRLDKRSLERRAVVGRSLRPWRTPPERAEDESHFLRAEAPRWWRSGSR